MIKIDKVYQPKEMLLAKKEKKECFTWEIQFSFLVWSSFNSVDDGYRIYFAIHNEHGLIQSSFLSMCFFPFSFAKENDKEDPANCPADRKKCQRNSGGMPHCAKSGVFLLVGVGFLWIFLPPRQERAGGKK